jgi:hypothetical protein
LTVLISPSTSVFFKVLQLASSDILFSTFYQRREFFCFPFSTDDAAALTRPQNNIFSEKFATTLPFFH